MSLAGGRLLLQQKRYDLAEKELRRALASEPNNAEAHALLSLCLTSQDKGEPALREAREAVRLAPDSDISHHALAWALLELNRINDSETAIREAIRLDPQYAGYHAFLATLFHHRKKWPEMRRAAEAGLALEPEHIACINWRSLALIKLGQAREAEAGLNIALQLDPSHALTHANLGWVLLETGDARRAMGHVREALRLDPTLSWAREGLLAAMRSRLFIYRWLLRYFLWLSRFTLGEQVGIQVGISLFFGFLRYVMLSVPLLIPIVLPIYLLRYGLMFLSWSADGLFNWLVRLDPLGRLALSDDELRETNLIGGLVATIVVGLGVFAVTWSLAPVQAACQSSLLIMVIGGAYAAKVKSVGRRLLLWFAVAMTLLHACGVLVAAIWGPVGLFPAALFVFGVWLFPLIANLILLLGR